MLALPMETLSDFGRDFTILPGAIYALPVADRKIGGAPIGISPACRNRPDAEEVLDSAPIFEVSPAPTFKLWPFKLWPRLRLCPRVMVFSFVSQRDSEAVAAIEAVAATEAVAAIQTVTPIEAVAASGLHERFPS